MNSYGYSEIRTPILERTELFSRGIGEVTDVVEGDVPLTTVTANHQRAARMCCQRRVQPSSRHAAY